MKFLKLNRAQRRANAKAVKMVEVKIAHNPRKIENKETSKRVQRAIMLKEFMEAK